MRRRTSMWLRKCREVGPGRGSNGSRPSGAPWELARTDDRKRQRGSTGWSKGAARAGRSAGESERRKLKRGAKAQCGQTTHPPVAATDSQGRLRPAMQRTYNIETFGCQMNVHDSERLAGLLHGAGYAPAPSADGADLVVVNTCSVRERAAEKLFARLDRYRHVGVEERPIIAVTGLCGAARRESAPRPGTHDRCRDWDAGTGPTAGRPSRRPNAPVSHRSTPIPTTLSRSRSASRFATIR